MNIIDTGDPSYNTIQFEWFLTNWCNFKCSYCSEAANMVDVFSKSTSAGKYKLVLARLQKLQHPFTVELIGGEPTLHPNITEIIADLCGMDNCKRVQIATNLSRSLQFYEQFVHPKISIIASYHPEHHTSEFVAKASKLQNINVSISLIDDPSYYQQVLDVIKQLKSAGVDYTFNMLTSTPSYSVRYTQHFYDTFSDVIAESKDNEQIQFTFDDGSVQIHNESEIFKHGLHKLKGYTCTPIRYRITHDGDIRNFCTGRVLPIVIGDSPYKQEVCPNEQCGCDAMFVFYKRRI